MGSARGWTPSPRPAQPAPSGGAVSTPRGSAMALCEAHDVALLDLDGVVYVGARAAVHAVSALAEATTRGLRRAFLTNNAARSPDAVADLLTRLGIPAAATEVVTSAQAAARLLSQQLPAGSAVLVVGSPGLEQALRECGLVPVRSADDHPAAVVQGYGPDVGWRQLAEAAYALSSGLPWVATNTDRTIPTARRLAPGNGTFVDALRATTGRDPVVAGKPGRALFTEALQRTAARRPLMVGDRLGTDIAGARAVGVASLVVLTGVTRPVDVVMTAETERPCYVGRDLRALLAAHPDVVVSCEAGRSSARCGNWTAEVIGDDCRLRRVDRPSEREAAQSADGLDVLRAACGAAWSASRSPARRAVVAALEPVLETTAVD